MPERKKIRWSELKVGVLAFTALLILAVLIFLLTGSGSVFQRNEVVHTFMANAAGITESTPVRLNGILVGAVQAVKLSGSKDPKRAVRFDLSIQEKYLKQIPVDSTAAEPRGGRPGKPEKTFPEGCAGAGGVLHWGAEKERP